MSALDDLRRFFVSNAMLNVELDNVQKRFYVELGHRPKEAMQEADFYAQLPEAIRNEADWMSRHYVQFYVLENSLREIVTEKMLDVHGKNWWDTYASQSVKDNVEKNRTREREAGVTTRSTDPIDYTTFGELGQIIQDNWDVFSDTFNDKKAVSRVLGGLNMLRGPIAHCCPLAPDEIKRLDLAIRDYFRLME